VGIRLTARRVRRGSGAPTPLLLGLRARLVGARLVAVVQPRQERILHVGFAAAEPLVLVCELIGRMANLILVSGSAGAVAGAPILAVARPVTAAMTRVRQVLPGRPYAPPPPQERPAAVSAPIEVLADALAAAGEGPAWRAVLGSVAGVGPLAAREAVFRAVGDPDAAASELSVELLHARLHELAALPATGAWSPSLARRHAGGDVLAWAPFELGHLASDAVAVEPTATLLAAIEAAEQSRGAGDPYREARAGAQQLLDVARARQARRRASLSRQLAGLDEAAIEALRLAGDLILSFQWQIAGQASFVPPIGDDAPSIALDPALTPVENAQAYFARYRRAKRALQAVPERLAAADAVLATLDQWATDLALAEDRAEIDAVRADLAGSGWLPGSPSARAPKPATPRGPLRWVSPDGLTVLVGRNSRQNEQVTFTHAARGDLWLHARGVPGAHVVVRSGGRAVPDATRRAAAALAAWFSSARGEARVEVTATDVRHVRRLKGGGLGMVTVLTGETMLVRPCAPEDLDDGAVP